METQVIIGVVVFAVLVYALNALQNMGPKTFVCSGHGGVVDHTRRTRTAVAAGQRPFCNDCHRNWLERRPKPPQPTGCMGLLLIGFGLILVVAGAVAAMTLP